MGDQGGVRWIARFTEFLRTATSRGVNGMDRVLDNLGFTHQNVNMIPTDPRMQRSLTSPLRFCPPEQLPEQQEPLGPPVPLSWASQQQNAPLFGPAQVAQLRQSQRDHPQLYGYPTASEGDSERSSRLQAEVQRQLEEYALRHQAQMQGLLQEVEALRAERREWQSRVGDQGDPRPPRHDLTVPQGNPQHQPSPQPVDLPRVPNEQQSGLPTVPSGQPVPLGVPLPVYEGQHGMDRLPQRDLQGPDAAERVDNEVRVSKELEKKGSSEAKQKDNDPTVPRGNPQHQPRGPEFYSQARGQESGPDFSQARGQESGKGSGEAEGPGHEEPRDQRTSTEPSTAQQWLGSGPPADAMTLIAGGVAQLQAAMLKQMSTDKSGEKTPETVKPGTNTLPVLPSVRPESASVDLLDWLELIEAPMSDLSDGSASWWRQVRSASAAAYDTWIVSGPMERLGVAPTAGELEDGKWSRVNSRAASMILTALDESIRSELVSRRMTGSVTAIVFRLLTLYQPGGEEEKVPDVAAASGPPEGDGASEGSGKHYGHGTDG